MPKESIKRFDTSKGTPDHPALPYDLVSVSWGTSDIAIKVDIDQEFVFVADMSKDPVVRVAEVLSGTDLTSDQHQSIERIARMQVTEYGDTEDDQRLVRIGNTPPPQYRSLVARIESREEINRLIRILQRARDKRFGKDA